MKIDEVLKDIADKGNLRRIPNDSTSDEFHYIDFSTNDYLGLATDRSLRVEFLKEATSDDSMLLSTSASRLLAASQRYHFELEDCMRQMYGGGKDILLFNSGYHANTGILPALSDRATLIVADRLVHASLIDGIVLSRCDFRRFLHNDIDSLERIIKSNYDKYETIIVVAESVYSMDGDHAPIMRLVELKNRYDKIFLYLDEAHAFGVEGPNGLGLAYESNCEVWDVIVGTFGKALASMGAFAVVSPKMKEFLINKCRSLIFSTALPPLQIAWTKKIIGLLPNLEDKRIYLQQLASKFSETLSNVSNISNERSHIQPLIIGNATQAIELSETLLKYNIKVLAIRTPTVPAGTERLRFSLSASMTLDDIEKTKYALENIFRNSEYK